METTTHTHHSHYLSPSATLDTMNPSDTPTFLKLEDLHNSSPAPYPLDDNMSVQATPPPVIVHSKPAKKRKSWGQELPEPTTNLPPRKRAKTEDEKEQRRIERIKRNRAAAHNSRERKRQETDVLAVALARANAELDAYRKHFGSLPSGVVLPEVTLSTDSDVVTPAPSLLESRGSIDMTATSPNTPIDTLFDYPVTIKEEESNDTAFSINNLPPAFDNLANKPSPSLPQLTQSLDPTQHSAAMLCDLQCRSSLCPSSQQHQPQPQHLSNTPSTSWWTHLILSLMTLQLQAGYKTLLLALWTSSPSRTTRLMQASTHRLISRSTTSSMRTPLLSRSTRALAQHNDAATGPVSTALQRVSHDDVRRARARAVAEQLYSSFVNYKALMESNGTNNGTGEGDDGVGR